MNVWKTVVIAFIVCACICFTGSDASAQLAGTIKDVVESSGSSGKIDWTTNVVTAVGIGAPPSQPTSSAQARGMAERAAQVVAYRNLLEAIKGVRVDATTTIENFMVSSDVIKTEVNGIIQGATVMDKKYMSDGSVEVTVGMKLTGALAETLMPKTTGQGIMSSPTSSIPGQLYTGLIVDARGLGIRPAMSPKILNEDGKEVYGSAWINRDFAIREGMVGYLKDPAAAKTNSRVADRPLMVKALKVSGNSRVDMVISNADAALLQSASENMSMLEKCRVIVLVD
ncbi:MAG: hypothetical protein WC539_02490 [Nitrospirota bacterium]